MNGGEIVAGVLVRHGVRALFTLCGGHISPILVASHQRGIRVIDTRHEATAVFAADAVWRLSGVPGVAAVTAGPGVTNTMTAITNARLAQSAVVILGGATAGILKGRGSLQDIDQISLVRSQVKWAATAKRVRDLPLLLATAFERAQDGVPGPVFLELPVDLLYDETTVREWFERSGKGSRLEQWYVKRYLRRQFSGTGAVVEPRSVTSPDHHRSVLREAAARLGAARQPVLVLGSQACAPSLAEPIERLGIPVYLSGMSRGLLGRAHRLQMRHRRKEALREADLVILAGVPADFRLNYGRDIGRAATVIAVNRSADDLKKNLEPDIAVHGDPRTFLIELSRLAAVVDRDRWIGALRAGDEQREQEIGELSKERGEHVNPLALCQAIDRVIAPNSVIVADGGDFVSTASYIVRPRAPLSWLDPGPFGTLGSGAGFALGAAVVRPDDERWLLYGDGALGFSIAELDTFARHRIGVIAVVANDGCWSQIHREQVDILGDDTGCMLTRAAYHTAAEGLGAEGLLLTDPDRVDETLLQARQAAAAGRPVLVNASTGKSAFRKGSMSM